jgi:hypothetical protein
MAYEEFKSIYYDEDKIESTREMQDKVKKIMNIHYDKTINKKNHKLCRRNNNSLDI